MPTDSPLKWMKCQMADKTINSQYSVLTLVNGEWPTKSFYATEQQQSLGCVWRCVSLSSNPSNRGFNALVLKLLFDLYNDDRRSKWCCLPVSWVGVGRSAGWWGGRNLWRPFARDFATKTTTATWPEIGQRHCVTQNGSYNIIVW